MAKVARSEPWNWNFLVFLQYRILHPPPLIDTPPNFWDHVGLPELSRIDLHVNAVYRSVKRCNNDLFIASHEIIQMYTKNSAVSQLITVTGPKSQVAISFQSVECS